MSSELSIKRNFLFRTFDSNYKLILQRPADDERYFYFCWLLLHKIIPIEAMRGQTLTDLKGDQGSDYDSNELLRNNVNRDELFYIKGERLIDVVNDQESTEHLSGKESETSHASSFIYKITSKFLAFEGSRHIQYTADVFKEDVPTQLTASAFLYQEQVDIERIRLGLQFFSSHSLNFLGFAPEVTQSLNINGNKNSINISIQAEKLKEATILPLQRYELLAKLTAIIREIFDFNLIEDYKEKIKLKI